MRLCLMLYDFNPTCYPVVIFEGESCSPPAVLYSFDKMRGGVTPVVKEKARELSDC